MLDVHFLVNTAADPAILIDTHGVVRAMNAAAAKLLGVSAIPEGACHDLLHGRDGSGMPVCSVDCPVLELASRGMCPRAFDVEVKTPAGWRWTTLTALLVRGSSSELLSLHLLRDIHARRKLELATRSFLEKIGALTGHEWDELLSVPGPHSDLTPREQAVLEHMVHGKSTRAISRELGISVPTVRNHVQHLMRKLSAHTRLQAVTRAIRDHIVPDVPE